MAEQAASVFEAVIVPHRSLSRRGLYGVIGAVSALSALISFFCWRLGAWPVVGFNGAEVGFAVLALNWHATSAARASEVLLLSAAGLKVVRSDRRGRREEKLLPVGWLTVVLEERPGPGAGPAVAGAGGAGGGGAGARRGGEAEPGGCALGGDRAVAAPGVRQPSAQKLKPGRYSSSGARDLMRSKTRLRTAGSEMR